MNFLFNLLRFWVFLLFGTLTGYIALTNNSHVSLHLPPFIELVNMPLYMALAGAFLTGAGVMVLFFGNDYLRRAWQVRQLNRRLADYDAAPRHNKISKDQKPAPSLAPADFRGA
jgi:uncharacterized integral membrane protein